MQFGPLSSCWKGSRNEYGAAGLCGECDLVVGEYSPQPVYYLVRGFRAGGGAGNGRGSGDEFEADDRNTGVFEVLTIDQRIACTVAAKEIVDAAMVNLAIWWWLFGAEDAGEMFLELTQRVVEGAGNVCHQP